MKSARRSPVQRENIRGSYVMGASSGVKFSAIFVTRLLSSMPVISTLRPHRLAHFDIYGTYRRQRPLRNRSIPGHSSELEIPLGGKWASFTRAAAKPGMSSTALSHSTHGLEGTTGVRPLHLAARRVRRLLANACSATRSPDLTRSTWSWRRLAAARKTDRSIRIMAEEHSSTSTDTRSQFKWVGSSPRLISLTDSPMSATCGT